MHFKKASAKCYPFVQVSGVNSLRLKKHGAYYSPITVLCFISFVRNHKFICIWCFLMVFKVHFGSGYGMLSVSTYIRQQVITWTKADQDLWHRVISHGHSELMYDCILRNYSWSMLVKLYVPGIVNKNQFINCNKTILVSFRMRQWKNKYMQV